ncbi:hypothetical protein ACIHDR_49120 [Nocardia sp. NPDC052278]|uniref:hypothetical protein n=1 Tax=unclassified Nocardia TaxID=2637762 RepID=UPI003677046D
MSNGMAACKGARRADDREDDGFYRLVERYLEAEQEPPTPGVKTFIAALLPGWPKSYDSCDRPCATRGTGDASGSVCCIDVVYERSIEVSASVANITTQHGLVCFDLQQGRLRS